MRKVLEEVGQESYLNLPFADKIRKYIGSPEGMGKCKCMSPVVGSSIRRHVITAQGDLRVIEVVLERVVGAGLSSIVYKGFYEGKEVVEKFTGNIKINEITKAVGKKFMELVFALFRQSSVSYRNNFYAAMSSHYASLIIESASIIEFGESIIPRLQYTCYDSQSGGYIIANEYISGRPIRPGEEEKILKENLSIWKSFIGDKLGLWGIARQCDSCNINSPANVLVVDEHTKAMKLIDITPGILGGQIYLLPLEIRYFFKGILTGNFLPFGDAVDIIQLHHYCGSFEKKCKTEKDCYNFKQLKESIQHFSFFLTKWRDSEPAVFRSPKRIYELLLNKRTMQATMRTMANNLEYKGALSVQEAECIRQDLYREQNYIQFMRLRICLLCSIIRYTTRTAVKQLYRFIRFCFLGMPPKILLSSIRFCRFLIKIYTNSTFRKHWTKEKFTRWIYCAQHIDRSITEKEANVIYDELQKEDALEILELMPLWTLVKIIKPPFLGTASNILSFYMLISTFNPYWLIPLFVDGIIRCIIAVLFTGFKHKTLLVTSLIPTLGFVIPVPVQLMKDSPYLCRFFLKNVVGFKIGSMLPGVDRHSFRSYFYIRLMNIPLFFMRIFVRIF